MLRTLQPTTPDTDTLTKELSGQYESFVKQFNEDFAKTFIENLTTIETHIKEAEPATSWWAKFGQRKFKEWLTLKQSDSSSKNKSDNRQSPNAKWVETLEKKLQSNETPDLNKLDRNAIFMIFILCINDIQEFSETITQLPDTTRQKRTDIKDKIVYKWNAIYGIRNADQHKPAVKETAIDIKDAINNLSLLELLAEYYEEDLRSKNRLQPKNIHQFRLLLSAWPLLDDKHRAMLLEQHKHQDWSVFLSKYLNLISYLPSTLKPWNKFLLNRMVSIDSILDKHGASNLLNYIIAVFSTILLIYLGYITYRFLQPVATADFYKGMTFTGESKEYYQGTWIPKYVQLSINKTIGTDSIAYTLSFNNGKSAEIAVQPIIHIGKETRLLRINGDYLLIKRTFFSQSLTLESSSKSSEQFTLSCE